MWRLLPLFLCLGCTQAELLQRYFFSNCPGDGPEVSADFEILIPDLDLDAYYAELGAVPAPYTVQEFGAVQEEDRRYPVLMIERRPANARRTLLVVAGVHGNESAGVLAVPRFLKRVQRNENWNLHILTPANPIGLVHGSRYNLDGCDVNRDFGPFVTPEADLVAKAIREFEPDIILSLHEGPQEGFFVIATAAGSAEIAAAIARNVEAADIVLAQDDFLGLSLGTPGYATEGRAKAWLKRLIRLNSLGSYATQQGIGTYTTESSWSSPDFEARIQSHVLAIEAVLRSSSAD